MQIPEHITKVLDILYKNGYEGYLVGGSVRDALMEKSFVDRDIAIKGAENFAKKLAEKFNATFIVLDPEYKIYRLVLSLRSVPSPGLQNSLGCPLFPCPSEVPHQGRFPPRW